MGTPSGLNGALSSGSVESDGSIRRDPITGEQLDGPGVGVITDDTQRCRPDVRNSGPPSGPVCAARWTKSDRFP